MQKYYDYHLHSTFSFDSRLDMAEACRLALERGLAGLTFTEHVELGGVTAQDTLPDAEAYAAQLAYCRRMFPQLQLGMGLELGLAPARREDLQAVLDSGAWDFVLGSVHELDGIPLSTYDGSFAAGQSKRQVYRAYFSGLLERVRALDCFDSLGHIDLIRRDQRFGGESFDYADYADIVDEILLLLISRGQGLEVNTGGWRFGLGEAHPGLALLRRYRQLGGEIITCGSDAHHAEALVRIPEGYQLIRAAGFTYVSLFEQRKLVQLKLEI